jgi:hypothetical protein
MRTGNLISFLRLYPVEELEPMLEDADRTARVVAIVKALVNEKRGRRIYDVPDVATYTGVDIEHALLPPSDPEVKRPEATERRRLMLMGLLSGGVALLLILVGAAGLLVAGAHDRDNLSLALSALACLGISTLLVLAMTVARLVERNAERTQRILDTSTVLLMSQRTHSRSDHSEGVSVQHLTH